MCPRNFCSRAIVFGAILAPRYFFHRDIFARLLFTRALFFAFFSVRALFAGVQISYSRWITPNHLSLDRSPKIGPLISRWEFDKLKNCWNKSFRTSKILTHLYQQLSNLLIFQQDISGPRLGALSNNRWLGSIFWYPEATLQVQTQIRFTGVKQGLILPD